jgi:hypothetical protein
VGLHAPEHPAAAVEVHEQAEAVLSARPVEARRDTARIDVPDLRELHRRRRDARRPQCAHGLGRRGLDWWVAERLELLE